MYSSHDLSRTMVCKNVTMDEWNHLKRSVGVHIEVISLAAVPSYYICIYSINSNELFTIPMRQWIPWNGMRHFIYDIFLQWGPSYCNMHPIFGTSSIYLSLFVGSDTSIKQVGVALGWITYILWRPKMNTHWTQKRELLLYLLIYIRNEE